MKDGIRPKKVAGVIQEALTDIFQRMGLNIVNGGMISISSVNMTPDLSVARVNLSFFNIPNPQEAIDKMQIGGNEIRHQLGNRIRNQVRHVPQLEFFRDDTLDEAFRIEELLKQIKK
jgi:ribosome-binding factor A